MGVFDSGTDEKAIVSLLGSRSNQQRQQLKLTYKTLFGRVRGSPYFDYVLTGA